MNHTQELSTSPALSGNAVISDETCDVFERIHLFDAPEHIISDVSLGHWVLWILQH